MVARPAECSRWDWQVCLFAVMPRMHFAASMLLVLVRIWSMWMMLFATSGMWVFNSS